MLLSITTLKLIKTTKHVLKFKTRYSFSIAIVFFSVEINLKCVRLMEQNTAYLLRIARLICAHGSKRNKENALSKNSFFNSAVECRLIEAQSSERWLIKSASDSKFKIYATLKLHK